ncbi:MAG: tRNA uridine(34) 5-carboxymethylaminomethyl modification radical SAM/GNAT enzyme Elp3, partial [Nanoarchaeota archaeon]|nr:tRNA uridine(34) 5-carboxymethylaminomethyl modification radical SAM/GNAT enzyme Elp3 [Nanoarchaeota archaeon]
YPLPPTPYPLPPRKRKPTRTLSGVTPVAVMLPPRPCPHGTCLYCPSYTNSQSSPTTDNRQPTTDFAGAPQSYTPESPAVLRAIECNYDPIKQIKTRIKTLQSMNHPTEKIELIIMGGTFLSYPEDFQIDFITNCYKALNNSPSRAKPFLQQKTKFFANSWNKVPYSQEQNSELTGRAELSFDVLQKEKFKNETAKHRMTALCIETRPDYCTETQIKKMLEWGATRVELGVQAIDDKIYKKVNRGHTVKDVIDATARLKKAGFKIGYHLMPGIPGSNPKKDIQMFKKIFSSKDFKPDQIKIYPCQVLKGAGIESLYYGGEYVPYTKAQVTNLIIKMLKLTPRYCRIMRIMREIPPHYLIAGIKNIDMRHDIEKNLDYKKSKIKEIRFREIGFAIRDKKKIDPKIKIKTTKYKASDGTEYFIEAINKDNILFGLLRLRLDPPHSQNSRPHDQDQRSTTITTPQLATVRELHVYGPSQNITTPRPHDPTTVAQHSGLGKALLSQAEKIANKKHVKKLRIISGVGVREYYKKLGYKLDKEKIYMEKHL